VPELKPFEANCGMRAKQLGELLIPRLGKGLSRLPPRDDAPFFFTFGKNLAKDQSGQRVDPKGRGKIEVIRDSVLGDIQGFVLAGHFRGLLLYSTSGHWHGRGLFDHLALPTRGCRPPASSWSFHIFGFHLRLHFLMTTWNSQSAKINMKMSSILISFH
jgi:hypothetical protein